MIANLKKMAPLPHSNTTSKTITSMKIPTQLTQPEDKTQTSDIGPTKEFHLFRELPFELRLQIWEEAAAVPQIVGLKNGGKFFVSTAAGCPLAHVCNEAKTVVMKVKKNI